MEREALAVQQGSFSFAICLLVLGLGINDPTWAQDEPVEPPAEQATEKKFKQGVGWQEFDCHPGQGSSFRWIEAGAPADGIPQRFVD